MINWQRLRGLLTLILALFVGISLISPPAGWAKSKNTKGKKVGFVGDPAKKRGVEYGFDKGYEAGKADKDAGLKPDPKRHEDFNKPEKYHRSEFGSQAGFSAGFKGGFVGGYQKAFGKKVKINVPGLHQKPKDPTAEKTVTPKPPDAASDAL